MAAVVLVNNCDLQIAVEDWLLVAWPVLVTLEFSSFHTLGQHHNNTTVVLPDHTPEVISRRRQRCLSGDELALRAETLTVSQYHQRSIMACEKKDFVFCGIRRIARNPGCREEIVRLCSNNISNYNRKKTIMVLTGIQHALI